MAKNLDLTKEDLVLKNMIVSECGTFNSKAGNPLINVQLVGGKKFSVLPNLLYFGERPFSEVDLLRGQKVDVLLGASNQGFNVKELYPVI